MGHANYPGRPADNGKIEGTAPAADVTDEMVARATIPNLAALTKAAIDRGLISSTQGYASA